MEIGRKFNRHQFIKRQQEASRFKGILANDYVKDIEQDFPTKLSSYDQTNWHPMTSLRGKNRKFLIHCFENRNQHDSLWARYQLAFRSSPFSPCFIESCITAH